MKLLVENKEFYNEDIYIDGHTWKGCHFFNCNIILDRGEFDLIDCELNGCKLSVTGIALGILILAQKFQPSIIIRGIQE